MVEPSLSLEERNITFSESLSVTSTNITATENTTPSLFSEEIPPYLINVQLLSYNTFCFILFCFVCVIMPYSPNNIATKNRTFLYAIVFFGGFAIFSCQGKEQSKRTKKNNTQTKPTNKMTNRQTNIKIKIKTNNLTQNCGTYKRREHN